MHLLSYVNRFVAKRPVTISLSVFFWIYYLLTRHGSLLTFWRFTNRIIIIIIIIMTSKFHVYVSCVLKQNVPLTYSFPEMAHVRSHYALQDLS